MTTSAAVDGVDAAGFGEHQIWSIGVVPAVVHGAAFGRRGDDWSIGTEDHPELAATQAPFAGTGFRTRIAAALAVADEALEAIWRPGT